MMTYEVRYARSASKELKKLPAQTRDRIKKAVFLLAKNPKEGNVRPMVGINSWRLRVGSYRVIYDIHDDKLVVLIVRVGHRRNIYKK